MLSEAKHPAGNVETLRFAQSDNHWFVMLSEAKHPAGNVETLRFAQSDNHWLI